MKGKLKKYIGFWVIFILTYNLLAQAVDPVQIRGHYPLKARVINPDFAFGKFIKVFHWDVSRFGNHGTVVKSDGGTIQADNGFSTILLGSQNHLRATGSGHISLPGDPFSGVDLALGLTSYFWISKEANGIAFTTQYLQVVKTNDQVTFLLRAGGQDQELTYSLPEISGEWYNLSFVYDPGTTTVQIFNGTSVVLTLADLGSLSSRFMISQLIHDSFTGGLAHVMFVEKALTAAEIMAIGHRFSQLDASESYVNRGMVRDYPLDDPDWGQELISMNNALSVSGATAITNRHGEPGKALQLTEAGNIILPYLLGESPTTDVYDESRGFTISIWIQITNTQSTPQEGATPVITPEDPRRSILYGKSEEALFGLQRVRDRMGVYTYLEGPDDKKYPWYNWFYDPVSFRGEKGWYHVIYVQNQYSTQVYVAVQDEAINCDCEVGNWECWYGCKMHYDYTSFKSLDDVTEWGLGVWGEVVIAQTRLDDFKVFRWPMDTEEVTALHEIERVPVDAESGKAQLVPVDSSFHTVEQNQDIIVYPNPSQNGEFSVRFSISNDGPVTFELINLQGVTLYKSNSKTFKGGIHEYKLRSGAGVSAGVYLLKIVAKKYEKETLVVVK